MNKMIRPLVLLASVVMVPVLQMAAQDIYPQENEKGKWGFVNDSDSKVVDNKYDEARNFENGLALVRKGDKYGMVNTSGKEVIPVKYNIIERHNDHIFRVAAGGSVKDGVLFDEKYGFVDDSGKELLKPEYDEIGQFNKDGLTYVKKGDKYGYINNKIEVIIPCKYNAIGSFNKDGFVWACEGGKFQKNSTTSFSGGKYGIYDKKGNVIVPVKYKTAGSMVRFNYTPKKETLDKMHIFERTALLESGSHLLYRKETIDRIVFSKLPEDAKGFYASNNSSGYQNAVYSPQGDMLVKEGKYYSVFYPTDGMAVVYDKKGMYNYLNISTGKLLFNKNIYEAWSFKDGVAVIERSKNEMELIDLEGSAVSSTYKHIYAEKDGVHIVQSDKDPDYILYGCIDTNGKEVAAPRFTYLYPPVNGMMAARHSDDSKCGFLGTNGKWVIEPTYQQAYSYKQSGLADVKTESGWGMIDATGKEVVKCQWKNTITPKDEYYKGYIWVTDEEGDDAGFMLLDVQADKTVSDNKYKWVRSVGRDFENVALVGEDEKKIGVMNLKGELIIPARFTFDQVVIAYNYFLQNNKSTWEDFDTYRVKLYSNPNRNKSKLTEKIESSMWDY